MRGTRSCGRRWRASWIGRCQRLLIFSDSRQDAAHQARFIIFASRFDRMRRRLVRILNEHAAEVRAQGERDHADGPPDGSLAIQRIVELLGAAGHARQVKDLTPCTRKFLANFRINLVTISTLSGHPEVRSDLRMST
ncbi:MAG: hypothetical protein NTW21_13065 [Verrucomicrobia bacterium]|nr:hypothetical protein [Verrucomicrobiota bacterium]